MAIYRNVHLSFWTDPKVQDDFSPEDRYFYLYILTNPHTNLVGCYEISFKQMSDETGHTKDVIKRLIDRLEKVHGVIHYSDITKELLIINWHKYNWTLSEKQQRAIVNQSRKIKNPEFSKIINDTLSIRYPYTMDTTDTDIYKENIYINNKDNNNSKESENNSDIETIKNIVSYLNTVCKTRYRHSTPATQKKIRARLKEGFTEEDFKKVIDTKYAQWGNDKKMSEFLRPETLFSTKFESYLNQKREDTSVDVIDAW